MTDIRGDSQDAEFIATRRSLPDLAAIIRHRLSESPDPGGTHEAIEILKAVGRLRPISDLLTLTPDGPFTRIQTLRVLEVAADARPVEDAADFAIQCQEAELRRGDGQTPLTDSFAHDVAVKRDVEDLAAFVRICRERDKPGVIRSVISQFTGTPSAQSHMNKALLYFALLREQCEEQAAELLSAALRAAADPHREVTADLGTGFIAAMNDLSPKALIVEKWIAGQMRDPGRVEGMIRLTARLLAHESEAAESLARHASLHWNPVDVYALADALAADAPACCATVRHHAALREEPRDLAVIILDWRASDRLRPTLDELLDEVVAGPEEPGPRPSDFLAQVDASLGRHAEAPRRDEKAVRECQARFRKARACHVTGQDGPDIARLLLSVQEVGNLVDAAGKVGKSLARGLLDGSLSPDAFASFQGTLRQDAGHRKITRGTGKAADLVRRAVSEWLYAIMDKAEPHWSIWTAAMENMTAAAVALYRAGLEDDAFGLLQECLTNDQVLNGNCVLIVTAGVRAVPGMANHPRWRQTVTRTVRLWDDGSHKTQAYAALRELYPDESRWISG